MYSMYTNRKGIKARTYPLYSRTSRCLLMHRKECQRKLEMKSSLLFPRDINLSTVDTFQFYVLTSQPAHSIHFSLFYWSTWIRLKRLGDHENTNVCWRIFSFGQVLTLICTCAKCQVFYFSFVISLDADLFDQTGHGLHIVFQESPTISYFLVEDHHQASCLSLHFSSWSMSRRVYISRHFDALERDERRPFPGDVCAPFIATATICASFTISFSWKLIANTKTSSISLLEKSVYFINAVVYTNEG